MVSFTAVVVDAQKLLEYCLSDSHHRGRNKARVFASVGIRQADVEELRTALLAAASEAEARLALRIRTDSATLSTSICSAKTRP